MMVWLPAPQSLSLSYEDVHVWCASMNVLMARDAEFAEYLSADEWQRVHRLVIGEMRRRFMASRGALRAILGRYYLDMEPEVVVFNYGQRGKPELAVAVNLKSVRFNVSHSGDVMLLAVTMGREVGVDVECMRPVAEADTIAASYFAPEENTAYGMLASEERLEAFYRCWTRKEAYMKARGEGFAIPTSQFAVSLADEARLMWVKVMPEEAKRWSLVELRPAEGYLGALAVEGRDFRVNSWCYEPDL